LAYAEHGDENFTAAIHQQLKTRSLPSHLDISDIDSIENVPGVYIFRDEARAQLYVGKSITLKKRVLSHFQSTASKELKISQQVHHVETIKTGNEFAALILESKLIKELQPIYNRLLRRASQYALFIASYEDGYARLHVGMGNIDDSIDLSTIYGIYRNKMQAKQKADELTRVFQLCPKLMGLEKTTHACFWYSLGKCRGACIGKEHAELYNRRFEIALEHSKVSTWEYKSAVQVPLSERGDSVVIDNWIIKGFIDPDGEMSMYNESPTFDVDEYKIIRRFLKQNHHHIRPYTTF
jgi:DNA polymerase-3 subunit epsilon